MELSVIREFWRYLHRRDARRFAREPRWPRLPSEPRFVPYVLSKTAIRKLLRLCAQLERPRFLLFIGSLEAGPRYAALLSLMLECNLVGANPYDYLVDVIDKIAADWPAARAAELLPRAWLAARQTEVAEQQALGEAT
jgi:IS66 C-terminal element